MHYRNVLFIALAFVVGVSFGRATTRPTTRPPSPPPDLTCEVGVMSLNDPGGRNYKFAPIRVVVDGRAETVPGVNTDGEKWRLDLADGRVTLFMVSIPNGQSFAPSHGINPRRESPGPVTLD